MLFAFRLRDGKSRNTSVWSALFIVAVGYYDAIVFSYSIPTIEQAFFPAATGGRVDSLLEAILKASYLMRFVGGIVLGSLADHSGCKSILPALLLLAAVPSLVIGVMPSFDKIGPTASVFVGVCRLLQSFSLGGIAVIGLVAVLESSRSCQAAFFASMLNVASILGAVFAVVCVFLYTKLFQFPHGWRIPFLTNVVFLSAVSYIGLFVNAPKRRFAFRILFILRQLFQCHARALFCVFLFSIGALVIFENLQFGFIMHLRFVNEASLASGLVFFCLQVLLFPVFGILADHFGAHRVMAAAMTSLILISVIKVFCLQYLDSDGSDIWDLMPFILSAAAIGGTFAPIVYELFPVKLRSTGIAVGWALATLFYFGVMSLSVEAPIRIGVAEPGKSLFVVFSSCVCLWALRLVYQVRVLSGWECSNQMRN